MFDFDRDDVDGKIMHLWQRSGDLAGLLGIITHIPPEILTKDLVKKYGMERYIQHRVNEHGITEIHFHVLGNGLESEIGYVAEK